MTERNRLRNNAYKSAVKTAIKKVLDGLTNKQDAKEMQTTLGAAFSVIDRAVLKGILKKNTAARYKSRIAKKVAQPA